MGKIKAGDLVRVRGESRLLLVVRVQLQRADVLIYPPQAGDRAVAHDVQELEKIFFVKAGQARH